MSAKEHFDIATHIYTRLRRLSSRTIDVIWMVHNSEYAQEVMKLARSSSDAETIRLAERFEQLMWGKNPPAPAKSQAVLMSTTQTFAAGTLTPATPEEQEAATRERYVGALR